LRWATEGRACAGDPSGFSKRVGSPSDGARAADESERFARADVSDSPRGSVPAPAASSVGVNDVTPPLVWIETWYTFQLLLVSRRPITRVRLLLSAFGSSGAGPSGDVVGAIGGS